MDYLIFRKSKKSSLSTLSKSKTNFGTGPVFLTAISTILGAVMFLRFGFAVGSVGFWGTFGIIIIGHLVTIPTAMALAEIATNQKVEGGGEYFIISRSFGINIGAAIGITLYLSQAISVAFYIIAFAEAFDAIKPFLEAKFNLIITDNRVFSLPALVLLIWLMIKKGAAIGVKALYFVVAILFLSIVFLFLGQSDYHPAVTEINIEKKLEASPELFYVFAIIFPAFTGMTAGVGLSGDLKNPKRSIPIGTLAATIIGMIVYILIAWKLAISASPEDLVGDQLIMSKIAFWGPIIPIGLAAATVSSALGSFMVAPRTLQALAGDRVFPGRFSNYWLSRGKAKTNEPRNATLITSIIAIIFVLMGDVNAVAEVISMFFMVTYGSLCLISFLQHFSADPSYRPSFKSKWYLSLLGAVLCIFLMFKMNAGYAAAAIVVMILLYLYLSYSSDRKAGIANIFKGVIFQATRQLQVFLQKSQKDKDSAEENWRPSVICISPDSFKRMSALFLMKWISHRYGFGTYIHFIKGYYSAESKKEADEALQKLIKITGETKSNIFLDTIICPSNTSAIVQSLQSPSISGKDNNMLLFEYKKGEKEWLEDIIDNHKLIVTAGFDLCILASSDKGFGIKKEIHIWLSRDDYDNANLMILLSYIILGHPDWKNGEIKIFALYSNEEAQIEREHLLKLTETGRLPISAKNINIVVPEDGSTKKEIISNYSMEADLTVIGFHDSLLDIKGSEIFEGYENIGSILFLSTMVKKHIT